MKKDHTRACFSHHARYDSTPTFLDFPPQVFLEFYHEARHHCRDLVNPHRFGLWVPSLPIVTIARSSMSSGGGATMRTFECDPWSNSHKYVLLLGDGMRNL